MDSSQIKSMGATLEAELMAFKHKKRKPRCKVRSSTLTTATPLTTITTLRGDLSYLLPPITVLEATICNVTLVTDTGVPLSLMRSPRYLAMERSILIDEEEIRERKRRALRP